MIDPRTSCVTTRPKTTALRERRRHGPIVALINDRDDHHERCLSFLAHYPGPLPVPTTVFTEVCMLVERRRDTRAELAFLADVRSGLFTLLETTHQ